MASYDDFIERVKEIHKIGAIQGHLGWDQETIMPPKAKSRSEILSWLAKEAHSKLTDPKLGDLITRPNSSNLDEEPILKYAQRCEENMTKQSNFRVNLLQIMH